MFGRSYPGLIEAVDCDDADIVLVTLGSIAGLARERAAQLRAQGVKAGLVRIRYMRPFPARQIVEALAGAAAVGVLEKDVSFGAEGTVMTNVCSALQQAGNAVPVVNFVGGLGGDDISQAQMEGHVRGAFPKSPQGASRPRIARAWAFWASTPWPTSLGTPAATATASPLPLRVATLKACATACARPMRKEADSYGFEREDPAR